MRRRALTVVLIAAAAYVLLGLAVREAPPHALWPIDAAGVGFAGHATSIALVFTKSCWWPQLLALGACAALLGWRVPAFRARAIFSIVTTIVAWQTSDLLKLAFGRLRPSYWYLRHEPSFAYASGHAMFAVVVYFLWAYFFATCTWPPALRAGLATLCALWGCGVLWSRLSLGAHWPTDLIGGALLGVTMVATGAVAAWSWPGRQGDQSPARIAAAAGRGASSRVT